MGLFGRKIHDTGMEPIAELYRGENLGKRLIRLRHA